MKQYLLLDSNPEYIILTMDHKLVPKNSSSAAVYTLTNTIYLKAAKVFEYLTGTYLLPIKVLNFVGTLFGNWKKNYILGIFNLVI